MSDFDDFDGEDDDDLEYLGRHDLDTEGEFVVDLYRDDSVEEQERVILDINDVADLLGVDINEKDTLLDLITQRSSDIAATFQFDPNDKDSRGGYTREEVLKFLDETGWWGISDVFYDEELEEYYVEINYEEAPPGT